MLLGRVFSYFDEFTTHDLLHLIKCEHLIPVISNAFEKYELGSLWDHLPAVLFFYAFFALSSAFGRVLSVWFMRKKLKEMEPKKRHRAKISWAHHVVACVNAVVSSILALSEVYRIRGRPISEGTHTYYPEVARLLSVGVGYFIWDVQICLKHYAIYGPSFLLHGIMALIALIISFRPYMMNLVPYYMLVEISTVFLHFNWFLIKMGLEKSTWYRINNSLLLTSYFIIRIIIAPIFVYATFRQTIDPANPVPFLSKTIYCGNVVVLALLSQYWFWKLAYKTFVRQDKVKAQ